MCFGGLSFFLLLGGCEPVLGCLDLGDGMGGGHFLVSSGGTCVYVGVRFCCWGRRL